MIRNRESTCTRGRVVVGGTLTIVALVITGCFTTGSTARAQTTSDSATPFADPNQLDPGIPAPQSVIGHAVTGKAVRYDDLVRYLLALADASPQVTVTPYAETHEGRALHYVTISSAENLARLETIRADNTKLADPRKLSDDDEAARIVEQLPGIAWMAYSIHGDELSSTDAAMQLAYQLAAGTDDQTKRLRDELVIHIDPLMNPDGRERYLSQLDHLTGKVPNPDYQAMQHRGLWSAGRGNHYLFDMNRDWLMQVHPETRGRAAAILAWNPHLLVDSHEMGGLDTYLFDPPGEPLSPYLSESNMNWRRRFGEQQARAFDRHGWSYYTGEWHEEWYPGYSNAWGSLLGAVGLLYEQAGVNAAAIKQASGYVLTYDEAVHHQLTSSLANLETLRANRREILRDYLADRRWAISGDESHNGVFLLPPPRDGRDRSTFNRFLDLLHRQGLETAAADAEFEAEGVRDVWGAHAEHRTFPVGTLILRSAQPHRRLLHAILGFDPHMTDAFLAEERKELESRRGSKIYDSTGWNLSMAYGLDAFWSARAAVVPTAPAVPLRQPALAALDDRPYFGYLIDGTDANIYRAFVRLFAHNCNPRVATKPFKIADHAYRPGTLLLRRLENPDDLPQTLGTALADLNLAVRPTETALCQQGPDLGGRRFRLLQPPRVAIASQWPISTTSFGSIWYLLDARLGLRASPINIQSLGFIDLRKYNVLILPNTWGRAGLSAVLGDATARKLKTWVESGGTLIAMGSTAAFLANKESGLSGVRLKRDVLDQLAVYEEALKRERAARDVKVEPVEVWDARTPASQPDESAQNGDDQAEPRAKGKPDLDTLKRTDEWERMFSPRGTIVAATLDPEHWLCFGSGERLPVLISGSRAFMSKHPTATPVRLAEEQSLRLSGLLWPEARQRWANTAYATVERIGNGQLILFANDPFFRGYWEGTGRLLLNAVLLGPGMGTSTPVPW